MNNKDEYAERYISIKYYVVILITVWCLVIGASLLWNAIHGNREVLSMAQLQARVAHKKDVIYRRWNTEHGGVYVPVSEKTTPNPYLETSNREIADPSGRLLTLINPAYMTRQVHELGEQAYGVHGHITSLNPIRPENAPDSWETRALKAFEQGIEEVSSIEEVGGEPCMRLMRPLITEEGCMKCHAKQGYKVGDIRGGISVAVPMSPMWALEKSRMMALGGGHGLIWLFGLIGIVLGASRLSFQIDKRRKAEEAVRRSEAELRILNAQLTKAKDLLKQSFKRYVSAHIVDEILESSQPVNLMGEKRTVSILLSDIRGFTSLSEQLEAEDLVSYLNSYFSEMIEIILEHEGMLDKFMGDAILALFGAPLGHDDDSLRAVKAALAMQEKLNGLNEFWIKNGKPGIRIGIGISTGEVVVGNIGSEKRLEYTVIGQDVNYAQRIEELTKELATDILISETTYKKVKDHVVAERFGPLTIRGKKDPITVYAVKGLKS
jgi:class 3 adenylate cyclase